jgi:hypothetical protein
MISRFEVSGHEEPLTVQFEPSGLQVHVAAGDHIVVEFHGAAIGSIQHLSGMLVLGGGTEEYGPLKAWHSDGREIETLC